MVNIQTKQPLVKNANGLTMTTVELDENNIMLNYFEDKGYTIKLSSSNNEIMYVEGSNKNWQMNFVGLGNVTLTLELLDGEDAADSASIEIEAVANGIVT